jgi:transketolase
MRAAFIGQLIEEASENEKVFLLVGDLGYSVVEPFAMRFPDRYLNVGIAEQNMAGIAAGLAMGGYCVYLYSIGNFPTLRCMEQIRYDICYHNLNVNIVAVGGGFSYGALGPSHHTTEEIGMLRTLPNLVVCSPGDPVETQAIIHYTASNNSPSYTRIGKAGEPIVHTSELENFHLGSIHQIKGGGEIAVFSTGAMLKYSVDYLDNHEITAAVFSFPFIKPIDVELLFKIVRKYKKIITIEEHQLDGGFGSTILELINNGIETGQLNKSPAVKRIGIASKFFSVAGSQQYLRSIAGLEFHKEDFSVE